MNKDIDRVLFEIEHISFNTEVDCSEYAELLKDNYNFDIFTVFFANSRKELGEFRWRIATSDEFAYYIYHTFCITKFGAEAFVIDITSPKRVIPLNEFILDIISLNQEFEGYKFVIHEGSLGSWIATGFQLRKKCYTLKNFDYKHSKERILGYTFISDLNRYLVIYDISTKGNEDSFVTYAVLDPEDEYNRTGVLKAVCFGDYFIALDRKFMLRDFVTTSNVSSTKVGWLDKNLNKILR